MKKISIEQALVWAYREQMVHVALPPGTPVEAVQGYSPALSEGTFLADKIDSSTKYGQVAHRDAWAIHQQVLRLPALTMARTVEEMEMLYARRLMRNDFDGMDHRATGDAARPIALVTILPRVLVQQHAMDANQPDRCDQPSIVYEKGLRVYTDRHGHIVTHHTRFGFNLLSWVGDDPLEVLALRRKYTVWHGSLTRLRDVLAGTMSAHQLSAELPRAPARD